MTFIFVLCDDCAHTSGLTARLAEASSALTPDEKRWRYVAQEVYDKVRTRDMTEAQLVDVVASDTSPLATLLKQRRQGDS